MGSFTFDFRWEVTLQRPMAVLGSFIFLLLAPGNVAGVVPWWISHWQLQQPFFGFFGFRTTGALLIVLGIPMLLDSFARFAIQGLGTPAPILPTQHLVITGLYRHVRNPMYVGVVATIVGQALLFANIRVLEYGLLVWVAFHIFVLGYEEPKLRKTFSSEYVEFCRNVPRWIPRLRPWKPESGNQAPAKTSATDAVN